jgi:hypothetical protein
MFNKNLVACIIYCLYNTKDPKKILDYEQTNIPTPGLDYLNLGYTLSQQLTNLPISLYTPITLYKVEVILANLIESNYLERGVYRFKINNKQVEFESNSLDLDLHYPLFLLRRGYTITEDSSQGILKIANYAETTILFSVNNCSCNAYILNSDCKHLTLALFYQKYRTNFLKMSYS